MSKTSSSVTSTHDFNLPGTEQHTPLSKEPAPPLSEPYSIWWSQGYQTHKALLESAGLAPTLPVSTIAFLGQSRSGCLSRTASIVNAVIGQNAFSLSKHASLSVQLIEGDASNEGLYMYVDKKRHTVYLHIYAPLNGEILASACVKAMDEINEKGFNPWQWKHQYWYIRAALFVFLMSNIVVISHPTPSLDTYTTSLLHTLAAVKRQIGPHMSSFVRGCWTRWKMDSAANPPWSIPSSERRAGGNAATSSGSLTPGRCIPVVLFIFEEVPIPSLPEIEENSIHKDMKISPYARIQSTVESRIRFVFRACHIIQSGDPHAPFDCRQLFALPTPSSIPFVHLIPSNIGDNSPANGNVPYPPVCIDAVSAMLSTLNDDILEGEAQNLSSNTFTDSNAAEIQTSNLTENRHEVTSKLDGIQLLRDSIFACVKLFTKSANPVTASTGGRQYSGSKRSEKNVGFNLGANDTLPSIELWIAGAVALQRLLFKYDSPIDAEGAHAYLSCSLSPVQLLDDGVKGNGVQAEVHGSASPTEGDYGEKKNMEKPESILCDMLDRKTHVSLEEMLTQKLENISKPENLFLENHCRRSLRKAVNVYLHELPTHYTKTYHQLKLDHAIRLYRSMARGSSAESFISNLENECTRSWMNGRRRCEFVSLTGHECVLPFDHQNPLFIESDDQKEPQRPTRGARGKERDNDRTVNKGSRTMTKTPDLSCVAITDNHIHSGRCSSELCNSQYQALHACNCGRNRRARMDAFNLVDANYGFFQEFDNCCANESATSIRLGLPCSSSETPMWSILKVGPGLAYRPNHGVDRKDGFIPGTSMLLPWEIDGRVAESSKQCRPMRMHGDPMNNADTDLRQRVGAPEEFAARRPGISRSTNTNTNINTSKAVKNQTAYIGLEYECPLGHRYYSRGNGRPSVSGNKDSAELLIANDQPIFCACPCNASNSNGVAPVVAQLQRVVIVTPDSEFVLELNAVVKIERLETAEIGRNTLSSHDLALGEKCKLPRDSIVALRLPYIYYDEHGEALPASSIPQTKFTLKRDFVEAKIGLPSRCNS